MFVMLLAAVWVKCDEENQRKRQGKQRTVKLT